MCGISGYFSENKFNIESIYKMIKAQHHRGPDDNGFWTNNENLALGHNRLSIQDLSNNASQPMISLNKNVLVFNGEIYNHNEIREKFLNNIAFHSSGDTQTLLNLIETKGIDESLKVINGMFAFCYFDKNKQILYLARDSFGEKPLYYGWQNKSFVFSSDLAAIKEYNLFENNLNEKYIGIYLKYGNIPYPYSIYEGIYKLDPGFYLTVNLNNKSVKKNQYWDPVISAKKNMLNISDLSISDKKTLLKNKLINSVKSKLISDVPIGSFLSSGIDSSLITSIMQSVSSKSINTFTIGFKDSNFNEAIDAKKISNFLNTNHEEYYFDDTDISKYAINMSDFYSEPFSDSSQIPTFLVSKIASKKIKVCLTGDGGDELFGGYSRYIFADRINNINYSLRSKGVLLERIFVDKLPDILFNFLNILLKRKSIHLTKDRIKKLFKILNQKDITLIYDLLTSNFYEDEILKILKNKDNFALTSYFNYTKNSKHNMMLSDTLNYLPNDILTKVDRASMANSIETRLPFLDREVFESAWSLNITDKIKGNDGKIILKNILSDYLPKKLINNNKKGFAIPIDKWIRSSLKDWAREMLSEQTVKKFGILNYQFVNSILEEHLNNKKNNGNQIWILANLNAWLLKN